MSCQREVMSRPNQPSCKQKIRTKYQVSTKSIYRLTGYEIHIISPRTSLSVPTSIGPSILPECQVSSWARSAPSLMLDCKGSVTTSLCYREALVDGIRSSSVVAPDENIFTIHLWNCSATSVTETANRFDLKKEKKECIFDK